MWGWFGLVWCLRFLITTLQCGRYGVPVVLGRCTQDERVIDESHVWHTDESQVTQLWRHKQCTMYGHILPKWKLIMKHRVCTAVSHYYNVLNLERVRLSQSESDTDFGHQIFKTRMVQEGSFWVWNISVSLYHFWSSQFNMIFWLKAKSSPMTHQVKTISNRFGTNWRFCESVTYRNNY